MKYFLICNKYTENVKIKEEFSSYEISCRIVNLLVKVLNINIEECNVINHLDIYYISDKIKVIDIIVCNEDNINNFI